MLAIDMIFRAFKRAVTSTAILLPAACAPTPSDLFTDPMVDAGAYLDAAPTYNLQRQEDVAQVSVPSCPVPPPPADCSGLVTTVRQLDRRVGSLKKMLLECRAELDSYSDGGTLEP